MDHLQLSDYLLSAERGYLSHFDPDRVELPDLLQPARETALDLPHSIPSGRVRSLLGRLPRAAGEKRFLPNATQPRPNTYAADDSAESPCRNEIRGPR